MRLATLFLFASVIFGASQKELRDKDYIKYVDQQSGVFYGILISPMGYQEYFDTRLNVECNTTLPAIAKIEYMLHAPGQKIALPDDKKTVYFPINCGQGFNQVVSLRNILPNNYAPGWRLKLWLYRPDPNVLVEYEAITLLYYAKYETEPGPPGKDGKDGATSIGVNGKDGAQGPKGDKGDRGATGPQGLPGKDGKPGKDGAPGAPYPCKPTGKSVEKDWSNLPPCPSIVTVEPTRSLGRQR